LKRRRDATDRIDQIDRAREGNAKMTKINCQYRSTSVHVLRWVAALLIAAIAGCSGGLDDSTGTSQEEAVGLSITGTIVGANANPLPGVSVTLTGTAQATTTTGLNGAYAFTGLARGSYSVQPALSGCAFVPTVVNLNNIKQSTTANFAGSGTSCGTRIIDSGGAVGSLTISGTVTDSSGNPVPGAIIRMSGAATGVRVTPATGSFTFKVNAGSYTLQPSGSCTYTPASANLNNIKRNATQNFTRTGCPALDGGVGDSGSDARADADSGATTDARDSCTPTTCAAQGIVCGPTGDGCGNTLSCGTCEAGLVCAPDGKSCFCQPTTSCPAGQTCGTAPDGCGGTLNCGTCTNGTVCDGFSCNCPAVTCAPGQNCGTVTNACGNSIDCGTCQAPATCGGGGTPGVCGHPCDVSTTTCLTAMDTSPGGCFQCASDSGCFDPQFGGGTCESVVGSVAACQSVLATAAAPTESQVCLATLKGIFTSHCAASLQEVPCLCGNTSPDSCQTGAETPTGPVYPIYNCDLGPGIGPILGNFTLPSFGAGMANAIIQCAQAFGCACQY
jgi:hypothetical protein